MGQMSAKAAAAPRQWKHIPRLVVFDLDYTLWFPAVDELSGEPFRKSLDTGAVSDQWGEELHFLPDVHAIMSVLETDPQFHGVTMTAIASRTTEIESAKACMGLMDVSISGSVATREADGLVEKKALESIADYVAIYPRSKLAHFEQFQQQSGVAYEDMLFFDDEFRNVCDVQQLGVTCQHCRGGLTEKAWLEGMQAFQKAKKTTV
ncbi:hypothetical protein BBJ28_00004695 [Nothophytophthora sp. Chile5]|nr:hypothetical protein BBJ28_00004695 [Nothophytophthora sp. Chile5]